MAKFPRIELGELYAKYNAHPSLLDIYVEGEFDRDLIKFLMEEMGYDAFVSVISIDRVEVSDAVIADLGLLHGSNKHRVIALAKMLDRHISRSSNVSCLVDADTDRLLMRVLSNNHLVYTDYTCMEMYCLNKECLKKFFQLVCNLSENDMEQFLRLAEIVLPVQFCLRAVNERLSLNAPVPPFRSGLQKKRGNEVFTYEKYLQAYLDREHLHSRKNEIYAEFEALMPEVAADLRDKAQGHDFVRLLFDFLSSKGVLKFQNKDEEVDERGGRVLSGSLVAAKVFSEGVFKRLEMAVQNREFIWVKTIGVEGAAA